MKTFRQSLALLRYELTGNGYLTWMVLGMATMTSASSFGRIFDSRYTNESILSSAFMCLIGITFYATCRLAPWVIRTGRIFADDWGFIMTRAIDRRFYYRIKTLAFAATALFPVLFLFGSSMANSELRLRIALDKTGQEIVVGMPLTRFQEAFPTALTNHELGTSLLIVPQGMWALAAWFLTAIVTFGLIVQLACVISWGRWHDKPNWPGALIYGPQMVLTGLVFVLKTSSPFSAIGTFLFFTQHWCPIALSVGVFGFLVQRYGERKFQALEIL